MVEALVALIILINIFMAIPLLGYLGEIKRQTVQASRYAAWERTVWYDSLPDATPGWIQTLRGVGPYQMDTTKYAVKSKAALGKETLLRFYGSQERSFTSTDGNSAPTSLKTFTPPGQKDDLMQTPSLDEENKDAPGIFMIFMGPILNFLSWDAFELLFKGSMDVDPRGYYNATISAPLSSGFSLLSSDRSNIVMESIGGGYIISANNAILTDTWNAQGPDHAIKRVKGLVPTGLLDNKLVKPFFNVWGALFPEFGSGWLDNDRLIWGHVDMEPVPCDRLGGIPPSVDIMAAGLTNSVDLTFEKCGKSDGLFTHYTLPNLRKPTKKRKRTVLKK